MNNDVLYEVVKYIDFPVRSSRVTHVQCSSVNSRRRIRLVRNILERKLITRPTVAHLKTVNIYREDSHEVDFDRIHRLLSNVFHRRARPFHGVSSSLACTVRTMEFKLKKILLSSKLQLHVYETEEDPHK